MSFRFHSSLTFECLVPLPVAPWFLMVKITASFDRHKLNGGKWRSRSRSIFAHGECDNEGDRSGSTFLIDASFSTSQSSSTCWQMRLYLCCSLSQVVSSRANHRVSKSSMKTTFFATFFIEYSVIFYQGLQVHLLRL